MQNNIEKLLKMLAMELTKIKESKDFDLIDAVRLELDRFNKVEHTKLKDVWETLIIEASDGREEFELGKYNITYKGTERFALDTKKLRSEFQDLSDDEFKNLLYSHSTTKPSIKLREKK